MYSKVSNNPFQKHLENSIIATKNRSLRDFWLNSDGSTTPKTSWLGRLVRWVLNQLFNKTTNDMWQVFLRAQAEYEHSRTALSLLNCENNEDLLTKHQLALDRGKRLNFVINFLLSRRHAFERLGSTDPLAHKFLKSISQQYKSQLKKDLNFSVFNVLSPHAKAVAECLSQAHQKQLETLIQSLKSLNLPSLKEESISTKPPSTLPRITKKGSPKEYEGLSLDELMTRYDSLCSTNKELSLHRSDFKKLINKTTERDKDIFGVNPKVYHQFYDQIECCLKNILFEIKDNPKLPPEKIKNVFLELAIAGGLCGARWLEESKRQFMALRLKHTTLIEHSVLQKLQSLKEDLLIELFQKQDTDYHILNAIRKELGEELGLDDSEVYLDIFTPQLSEKTLKVIKRLFRDVYTPKRIINGLKERINLSLQEAFDPDLFIYLDKKIENLYPYMEDSAQYVIDHFMKKDFKSINKKGVIFLLKEMGILHS